LERMALAIFREWFLSFQFPGSETMAWKGTELERIPLDWELKAASECLNINPRISLQRDLEKPFVPMTSLASDSMVITDIEIRTGSSGATFQNGDTLFARITPCLENGKTAFVQLLPAPSAAACGSPAFIVLRS